MYAVAVPPYVAFVISGGYAGLCEHQILFQFGEDASTPNARQHISYCHMRLFLWIAGDYACRVLERSRVRPTAYSPSAMPCLYRPVGRVLSIRGGGMLWQPPTRGPSLVVAFLLTQRANQLKPPTFPDGDLQDVDDAASEVLV